MIALVMAGGRASRLRSGEEKGLLKVGGKTLLERAAHALSVPGIEEVLVASTERTPGTSKLAESIGSSVVTTKGIGYHEDILELLDAYDRFVSLNVDAPFVKRADVTKLLEVSEDESLAGVLPMSLALRDPDRDSFIVHQKLGELIWVGLNFVTPEQELSFVLYDDPALSVNVNTEEDLAFADRLARERSL